MKYSTCRGQRQQGGKLGGKGGRRCQQGPGMIAPGQSGQAAIKYLDLMQKMSKDILGGREWLETKSRQPGKICVETVPNTDNQIF